MTGATSGSAVFDQAVQQLEKAGVPDPLRDATVLLSDALQVPRHRLADSLLSPLPEQAATRFAQAISARANRQPVSQIIGRRAFWKHDFLVTRDTLDPRPETETLIEAALKLPFERVLDLGTGSGAILISLLDERRQASGVGTDISAAALQVAQRNAAAIGVAAEFILSDWFTDVQGQFDLIVSNPPYIALSEMAELSPEVREWEPWGALTDNGDGLAAYRSIAAGALSHLLSGGRLLVEIGPTQAEDVIAIFTGSGLVETQIHRDLDGRDRVIMAQKPAQTADLR